MTKAAEKKTTTTNNEVAVVYVTKYVLTAGIERRRVRVSLTNPGYAYSIPAPGRGVCATQYGPSDWHRTEEAARKRADAVVQAKKESLRKALSKLESLRVKVVDKTSEEA